MKRKEFGFRVGDHMTTMNGPHLRGMSVWDMDDPDYVEATILVCIEIAERHFRCSGDMAAGGIADELRGFLKPKKGD